VLIKEQKMMWKIEGVVMVRSTAPSLLGKEKEDEVNPVKSLRTE
jgi:hypothetical protein